MFNAFISYSHSADGKFARALQNALQKFAKPWYKKRNLEIFRDESSLSASPHLWDNITKALDKSEYLILLASPISEKSEWVNKEVEYWLEHKSVDTILIALTDGEMSWDSQKREFLDPDNNSLPPALDDKFAGEPFYVDLRQSKTEDDLSLDNPIFKKVALKLAAKLHHKAPNDLASEEVSEHRKMITLRNGAIAMLSILLFFAIGLMIYAFNQRSIAEAQTKIALEKTKIAEKQTKIARDSSNSAQRQRQIARDSSIAAMKQRNIAVQEKDNAFKQTKIANEQRVIADTRSLVVQSKALEERDPTRALRLLEQAHALRPSPEVSYEVARTFYSLRQKRVLLTSREVVPNRDGRSAVSLDGNLIASWSEEFRDVRIWSREGVLLATLEHQKPMSGVSFLPGSQLILTVSSASLAAPDRVQIWSSDGSLKSEVPVDIAPFAMAQLPNDKGFAIGAGEKVILVDYNGQPYKEIPLPRFMQKLKISQDGSRLVVWSTNYQLGTSAHAYLLNREGQQLGHLTHKNSIWRTRILDDGRVLTWGGDNFVRIWDGKGKLLLEIGDLVEVAVSRDGHHVGLFWKSGRFGFLNLITLQVVTESSLGLAGGAKFSKDESRLVVWFEDSTVKVLDLEGKVLSQFKHGQASIVNTSVSNAGHRVLTWDDRIVRIWNDHGGLMGEMAHDHGIDAANLLDEGDEIVSWEGIGSGGLAEDAVYKALLWRSDGELIGEMQHQAAIRGVDYRAEDGSILTWADDGSVKLWRQVEYTLRVETPVRAVPIGALFSNDDELILVWFKNGLVQLLNARGQCVRKVMHSAPVAGARIVGDRFWSWTGRGEIFIWDRSQKLTKVWSPKESYGIAFATNANRFITRSTEQAVIWDEQGKTVAELSAEEMRGAVLSPDGRRAVTWDANGDAILWGESGDRIAKITHDERGIRKVLFSPDGQRILFHTYGTGSEKIEHPVTLRRWDGSVIADIPHADAPLGVMFVPNHQRLLTWWERKAPAKLWDLDGELISTLTHGEGVGVPNLRVSRSGRIFVTWVAGEYSYSPDELKIWDRSGDAVATLLHPTRITQVSINSQGSHILTTTHSNWIRIWDIAGNLIGKVNHGAEITGSKFLERSKYVLVWGGSIIRLLNYSGELVMEVKNMPSLVRAVSNDETTLLMSSWQGLELILTPKGIWQWLRAAGFYQLSTDEKRSFRIPEPID